MLVGVMMAASVRPTPVVSDHARERCAEMSISTKVAKAIYRHANVIRPGRPSPDDDMPRLVANSDRHPGYSVVFVETPQGPVIVTVLFRTQEDYVRDGASFIPVKRTA